jgi:hypothetical protein
MPRLNEKVSSALNILGGGGSVNPAALKQRFKKTQ